MDSRSSRRYETNNSRDESNSSQHKEHINIPHMRYKLTKLTQAETLYQIAMKTSGFYNMSMNSVNWVQRDVRNREFSSFGSLKAPEDMKLVDIITGDNDYYLKLTMKNHVVDYICYDTETNKFEFWGEYQSCIRAMNEVRYRIEKIKLREATKSWPTSNGVSSKYDDDGDRDPYARDSYARDEYARDSYARDSYARDEYGRDAYSRGTYGHDSDSYDCESYGPDANRPRKDLDTAPRKNEDNYSKFANTQMSKMGFTPSHGLGRNNTGRLEPIDPINDLGGRTGKNNFGLGFLGLIKVDQDGVVRKVELDDIASSPPPPPQPQPGVEELSCGISRSMSIMQEIDEDPRGLSRSMSIMMQEEVEEPRGLSRSMSCSYYSEEPPCSMMQSMCIISEEEDPHSIVLSMSITAD